jgi:hypothetical protein
VEPDQLADELVRSDLADVPQPDLGVALDALAEFRAGLPPVGADVSERQPNREMVDAW